MKNSKILFVSHEYNVGGSTQSLVSLIRGIEKISNCEVKVVIPYQQNGIVKEVLKEKDICYKEMLYRHNYRRLSRKCKGIDKLLDTCNFIASMCLFIYLKVNPYDYVCSNSTAVDVGARAAKWAKVKHIYYVRELMEKDHGIEYRNKKGMQKLLEQSDFVIFISKLVEKNI